MNNELYPFRLKERIRRYAFGGRRIPEHFGPQKAKRLPDEPIIAETWEVTDHGEEISIVENGPLAGKGLRELVQKYGHDLIGTKSKYSVSGGYPLLIKFLDAQQTLGMQVHPDDEYAAVHEPGENGKTEAWYVIAADLGATLFSGNVKGLTREELVKAIADGNPERCMDVVPVAVGDMIYVPAGRMHAIGKGILVYEPQQSCDITYGPRGRPGADPEMVRVRVQKFVEACHLEDLGDQRIKPVEVTFGKNRKVYHLVNQFFNTERLLLEEPWQQKMDGSKSLAFSCLDGEGEFVPANGGERAPFVRGESVLCPAAMGDFAIEPKGRCEMIYSYVPDIKTDVIDPLLAAGIAKDAIIALGGPGKSNDVAPYFA